MSKKRQLIIFAIVIVVLIGVSAGAAVWWSNYQVSKTNQSSGGSNNTGSTGGSLQPTPAEKTADDADQLAYEGDVQGGVKKLDEAIQNTHDNEELFTFYSRKATLLLNNNELSGALDAAKKAYDLIPGSESGALVGQIAKQMGDKATAIAYYQKAIEHIDPTDPYAKTDKSDYQAIIAELQGAQ
jgi:tetratricopeptide (TPR) repeat protein